MIDVTTLTDGGQRPEDVARRLASFLDGAASSLDIAVYDVALSPPVAEPVLTSIRAAAGRGVAIRVAYNVDHDRPIPVPPPPRPDPSLIEAFGVPSRAIPGIPDLMHHKFVVRDGRDVWAGSTNWTDDSWTREENLIVTLRSEIVAGDFARDFEDLWSTETVRGSGEFDPKPDTVGGSRVQPWFSPGRGRRIAHRIAGAIGRATRRVRIASPVLTSGPILGTLTEVVTTHRVDVAAVVDGTQMAQVHRQWSEDDHAGWKIPAFACVVQHAPIAGKRSTPWAPGAIHDYMHAKVTVADDVVFVGSYNLSHSGEDNAENVLEIEDAALADRMAAFIDEVRGRYPRLTWPPGILPGHPA
ncbi:MAG: phosphatidylserine/phosphatidylglycerophosphate/cardiolipin synthase family protein [Actinomycetota bacterium]